MPTVASFFSLFLPPNALHLPCSRSLLFAYSIIFLFAGRGPATSRIVWLSFSLVGISRRRRNKRLCPRRLANDGL